MRFLLEFIVDKICAGTTPTTLSARSRGNCYNRGINMVQDELEANGNGKAEFSFRLITAFEAKVAKAGQRHNYFICAEHPTMFDAMDDA